MKIIEAMKRLKVILKRMQDNIQQIALYSSCVSTEKPAFGSEDEQRKKVQSLVQANHDLMSEYLRLKRGVEITNNKTTVSVRDKQYLISELLVIRRVLAQPMINTFNAMSTQAADSRIKGGFGRTAGDNMPTSVRMFDEAARNKGILEWQELYSAIDAALEVVNATSDLIED